MAAVWPGGPIEFERVVPPSGNLGVAGKQFWLDTSRTGQVITFWNDTDVIHLLAGGVRLKNLRSHLSTADLAALFARGGRVAGPSSLPQAETDAVLEVERTVTKYSMVSLGGRYVLAAEILAGRRVTIRIGENTLMFLDPDTRELLRTRPNPLIWQKCLLLRGARPAGPPLVPAQHRSRCSAAPTLRRHHGVPSDGLPRPPARRPGRHRPRQRHHADHRSGQGAAHRAADH